MSWWGFFIGITFLSRSLSPKLSRLSFSDCHLQGGLSMTADSCQMKLVMMTNFKFQVSFLQLIIISYCGFWLSRPSQLFFGLNGLGFNAWCIMILLQSTAIWDQTWRNSIPEWIQFFSYLTYISPRFTYLVYENFILIRTCKLLMQILLMFKWNER